MARSSIQVSPQLRRRLERRKSHPRQAYEEVIGAALDAADARVAPQGLGVAPAREAATAEMKKRLVARYGERLTRIILFGSSARGDARPDSDLDLLVVIRDEVQPGAEIEALVDDELEVEERFHVPISVIAMSEREFFTAATPLLINVRREGIAI